MRRPRLPGIVPRPRLLMLALGAAALVGLGTLSPVFVGLAVLVLAAALALAVADYRLAPAMGPAEVARIAEPQLIIGAPNHIGLAMRNPTVRPLRLRVRDEVPVSFAVVPRVTSMVLEPAGSETAEYVARPRYRGSFRFGALHTRQRGPLDLVERQSDIVADAPANVYPDLREIRRYEVTLRRGLAYDAGQRRARLPGAGSVFERLREYGPDDDPRSISWPATARRGRPISVEYETERQQRVLILLDAGRMMASTLGELTKLDHAVNTALMLSYVATAKGDEVGLLGFADDVRSYLLPRRGRRQFLRVTEELRKLEVTTTEPDYRAAFEFLRSRTSRRALVVLFTDLVDVEASRSLVAAVNRLAGNNLVLCCLLADPQLAEVASRAPRSTTELYERVIAQEVRDARARALALLRERGVHVVDVPAERLTVAAIQRYLELKKRWL
ncbi:MAG TPA: DUF58 domain-containing protein [Candidatus Saccharimonadales bacterium]|nr:DUF58 domain-containing protein [Candidatus Saccharimonadales bacterium]